MAQGSGRRIMTAGGHERATSQPWIAHLAATGILAATSPPQRVETQISVVFLTADRAFKLKKAVRLPFLDYATLSQRARMTLREFWINRFFAPPLYVGLRPVLAVGRGEGQTAYRIGPRLAPPVPTNLETALARLDDPQVVARILRMPREEGKVVDWLVEMRRFAEAARWDRRVARGDLTMAEAAALADVIAANHAAAPRHRERPAAARLMRALADVIRTLEQEEYGPWGQKARLDAHRRQLQTALAQASPLLEARRRHGFQRRCHGDMHLANICTLDDRPWPFDAIEFSDDIGIIDCAYDLAFPVMDMLVHKAGDRAWELWNRVIEASGDVTALRLGPLLMALRATIRAMAEWGAGHERMAASYRRFAESVLMANDGLSHRPLWIAIGGLSGSGKSALARILGPRLGPPPGMLWLRSDGIRKRLFARRPEERLPPDAYTPESHERCYRRLLARARAAARARWPAILDATWLSAATRAELAAQAARCGVRLVSFWLDAPEGVLRARVAARKGDASDADTPVLARQLAAYAGPPVGWTVLDATRPLSELTEAVIRICREENSRS